MEFIWLEYVWILLILIGLEGLLLVDNVFVLVVIVKYLFNDQKKKVINYGIIMVFVFWFVVFFVILFIVNVWQIQVIGVVYFFYLGLKYVIKVCFGKKSENIYEEVKEEVVGKSFWFIVGKIVLVDFVFVIDLILVVVVLVFGFLDLLFDDFGGMDGG